MHLIVMILILMKLTAWALDLLVWLFPTRRRTREEYIQEYLHPSKESYVPAIIIGLIMATIGSWHDLTK